MTEISQELAQRMAKVIHEMDARYDGDANFDPTIDEIRKLAFLLPKPVDPVLLKAREFAAERAESEGYEAVPSAIRRGDYDDDKTDCWRVQSYVAGIRAGIEMAAQS